MNYKSTAAIAIVGAVASFALFSSKIPTPGTYLLGDSLSLAILDPEFLDNLHKYNKVYLSGFELRKRLGIFMER
jgi:hypothetical protein